jgi:prevent-host-death family protein
MHIENINDAKAHLSHLIKRALAGDEVLIARAGEPLVRLVPCREMTEPRRGGQWRDRLRIADDFDAYGPDLQQLFSGDGK